MDVALHVLSDALDANPAVAVLPAICERTASGAVISLDIKTLHLAHVIVMGIRISLVALDFLFITVDDAPFAANILLSNHA
jgi:hypothetical protein